MSLPTDLTSLRHFVAVYRQRSFRLAAEELGVAQSSVTKRIQRLEEDLDVRLFNRTTRSVEPTDSARRLIDSAQAALAASRDFDEEARLLIGGDLGAIRVSAIALAAETLIVGALAGLARSHPNLEVEVIVGSPDVYHDLASGKCDVVVGDEANFAISPHAPGLRMERLQQEKLVFVHRRGHPATQATALAELLVYPVAIPSRYFNENRLFETMAALTEPQTAPRYRLNSLSACIALAAESDVVTLAPGSIVGSSGKFPAVDVAAVDTNIELTMVLVTIARNSPTPAVRAFREAMVASANRD